MRTAPLLHVALGAAVFAACAAEAPRTSFDDSAGVVVVDVGSDGFVRWEGRREPLEACVLTLRQRVRTMTPEQRAGLVVQLRLAGGVGSGDADAQDRASKDLNRMLDHLHVMGVTQVRYL
ncbi:MAG: hypothetical protein JNN13_14340 [Planctomycetes bacterium]|nr:hypothetical protein [Planctomycetota bacterium]